MRDTDVRRAVLRELTIVHANDADTRVVEEMGVWSGSVRIDVAVINGELSGYELKSDRDTLDRLPFQAELYSKVFDKVYLVVGLKHEGKARRIVPRWWGVLTATMAPEGVRLRQVREAKPNPSPDPEIIAQLVWKEEALSILEEVGLAKGWRGKRMRDIHRRLATELSLEDLSRHVRATLKRRQEWLGQSSPGQLDVAIDSDLDPLLKVSGTI